MEGHFVKVLNQVLPEVGDPGPGSRFLLAGGHPLLEHRDLHLHIAACSTMVSYAGCATCSMSMAFWVLALAAKSLRLS
jgi:hypothetical protein